MLAHRSWCGQVLHIIMNTNRITSWRRGDVGLGSGIINRGSRRGWSNMVRARGGLVLSWAKGLPW